MAARQEGIDVSPWLFGFPQPVVELSILFWLLALGAGTYYGMFFEDVLLGRDRERGNEAAETAAPEVEEA